MSIVEKMQLAITVIEKYQLQSVIAVDVYTEKPVSIQIHNLSELERISGDLYKEINPHIEKAYSLLDNVQVFVVTSDVSDWLESA